MIGQMMSSKVLTAQTVHLCWTRDELQKSGVRVRFQSVGTSLSADPACFKQSEWKCTIPIELHQLGEAELASALICSYRFKNSAELSAGPGCPHKQLASVSAQRPYIDGSSFLTDNHMKEDKCAVVLPINYIPFWKPQLADGGSGRKPIWQIQPESEAHFC